MSTIRQAKADPAPGGVVQEAGRRMWWAAMDATIEMRARHPREFAQDWPQVFELARAMIRGDEPEVLRLAKRIKPEISDLARRAVAASQDTESSGRKTVSERAGDPAAQQAEIRGLTRATSR